jgi:putative hemolysin
MELQIKEAHTEAERLAIYQLRYRVYVEEFQLAPALADHDRKLLVEPLDAHAHNFYAAEGGAIRGALRLLMRREGALDHEDLFDLDLFRPFYPDAVSMTTKLVVVPDRRASTPSP